MAQTALDAGVLVDARDDLVVEIELLPTHIVGHGAAAEVADGAVALLVHPVRQAVDHVLDDLESLVHGGGTDLHGAGAHGHVLRRVAPGGDAADARDGLPRPEFAGDVAHHAQGHGLDRRSAIAAVAALAVHLGQGRHGVEVDADDRGHGVDQRNGVGLGLDRRPGGRENVGDVRRQLDDHRHARVRLGPARHHFHVFRHLADRGAHAALRHAVRTAEVDLDAVGVRIFHLLQDVLPIGLLARHHEGEDDGTVGPVAFHRLEFAQVDLERPVRDQLDVGEARDAGAVVGVGVVARGCVDDGFADGLPDHAAPARLKGADHVVFLVRGRA